MGGLLLLVGLCVSLHALYRFGLFVLLTLDVLDCHGSGVRNTFIERLIRKTHSANNKTGRS